MHTLEIKLKQHTPLIQFQPDQEGATLRASEVKPRLDRYILTKIGGGQYNEGVRKIATDDKTRAKDKQPVWLIGNGDKLGLNYKMKITANEKPQSWDMEWPSGGTDHAGKPHMQRFPMFFGNMNAETPKKMSFCRQSLNLTITTFDNELLNTIKKYINQFFIVSNFGTRQTKGFGSFLPEGINVANTIDQDYAVFEQQISNPNTVGTRDGFYKLFTDIDYFYKTIRSGINQQGIYLKSLMFFYAADTKKEYWDKRTIRHTFRHFTPNRYNDQGEKFEQNRYGDNKASIARLYRDCLGLSSSQEWMKYKDTITKEYIPSSNEDIIDRFKSPILIKPIIESNKYVIYLIPSNIPDQYLNAEFRIKSRKSSEKLTMKTPHKFDTRDYLQYVTNNGIRKWVIEKIDDIDATGKGERIKRAVTSIYRNIKYVKK